MALRQYRAQAEQQAAEERRVRRARGILPVQIDAVVAVFLNERVHVLQQFGQRAGSRFHAGKVAAQQQHHLHAVTVRFLEQFRLEKSVGHLQAAGKNALCPKTFEPSSRYPFFWARCCSAPREAP